ncbi:unnamed protein product [Peronospora belbahrii]|nr:unnamed protein product [Peronospora belbahrii]
MQRTFTTASTNNYHQSRPRSHYDTLNVRSHARHETREHVTATADFCCTNPIINEDFQEEKIADEQDHINFSSARHKKAAESAKRKARGKKEALAVDAARPRHLDDSFSPIRPMRIQTFVIQDDDDENDDRHDTSGSKFQQQDAAHPQDPDQAKSRKQSISASWTCCGYSHPHVFLRLCTVLVVVPLVVCGLILWPVLAAAMMTTILLCVCCCEHAWLSYRIHSRLIITYQWYEGKEGPTDAVDSIEPSTRSEAAQVCGYQEGERHFSDPFASSSLTDPFTSFPIGRGALGSEDRNTSVWTLKDTDFSDNSIDAADPAVRLKSLSALSLLDSESPRGILLGAANYLFCENLWLARVSVAVFVTVCWSLGATMILPLIRFPVASLPHIIASAPYYFWVVNFVASLCAVCCPTWPRAISLVVQKSAFEIVLLNALHCPLAASVNCSAAPITSLQSFALGAMTLMMVHSLFAREPANLVVGVILDLMGYAYIAGALGLLITMIDSSDRKSAWAMLWLGMLSAMWTAQFAGYVCDHLMSCFQIPHMRLLPSQIIVTLNVEASICAIAASSVVLIYGGAVLNVPGDVLPKVLLATSSVLMARFGQLVLTILKKAAGVHWSGCLLPGFGGALDGAHALLFTSIVFVKYYLYMIARQTSDMDDQDGGDDFASWATVTFSTDLGS